jgi:hypothetical protein
MEEKWRYSGSGDSVDHHDDGKCEKKGREGGHPWDGGPPPTNMFAPETETTWVEAAVIMVMVVVTTTTMMMIMTTTVVMTMVAAAVGGGGVHYCSGDGVGRKVIGKAVMAAVTVVVPCAGRWIPQEEGEELMRNQHHHSHHHLSACSSHPHFPYYSGVYRQWCAPFLQ